MVEISTGQVSSYNTTLRGAVILCVALNIIWQLQVLNIMKPLTQHWLTSISRCIQAKCPIVVSDNATSKVLLCLP